MIERQISHDVPTVHLHSDDKEKTAKMLRAACINVGFFYLESHGLDTQFLDEVLDASKELFNLPLSEKRSLSDHVMSRGYTSMGEETLDPVNQKVGDTKEGFYIGQDIDENHPLYNPAKLSGPNVWPGMRDECSLRDSQAWKEVMQIYFQKCCEIGFELTQLIAISLGLEEHYFDMFFSSNPLAALRLLHYSSQESDPDNGIFACGAHSDYGMLTLLLTDQNSGLQIKTLDSKWISVPPKKGAFIVNLGDMLERWTNGQYLSTMHRVVSKGGSDRYSIPFFYEPSFDTEVSVLDCCIDESNPPKYPTTTSGQHLLDKYRQTHAEFRPA